MTLDHFSLVSFLNSFHLHNKYFISPVLRDYTPRFVGPFIEPLVCQSVTLYFFLFFAVFDLTAPTQMIK